MKNIYEKKLYLIIGGIALLITLLVFYLTMDTNKQESEELSLNITTKTKETFVSEKKYIDIKGSVKNPGVYEFKENDRVIDAIKMAGGLKKNANTDNINLSEKLKSEMVIYIYNNSEIKKGNNVLSCNTVCETNVIEINNCIEENNTNPDNNNLININTADINELMTLTGIGESKAQNIIDYRTANGPFKSIEEIKNISGIGDALYEKIKDKITV